MKSQNVAISTFESPEQLATGAITEWLQHLRASQVGKPVTIALPGGRIYRLFFKALAELASHEPGLLERVHFFWGDERCVPPDHAESNFKLANDLLLGPLRISTLRVHRIRGEDHPVAAASAAEADLRRIAPATHSGQPQIDYVFLGMGEDGHTASLFPGESPDLVNSPKVYRAISSAPKPPPRRITLGYPALTAAANVWVLISGPGKQGALRQSLIPSGATPLSRVLSSRSRTRIFTDVSVA